MFDDAQLTDSQRTVRSMHIKPGGLFTPGSFDVEYEPIKYEFVDKAKTVVVCNACQGAGKRNNRYGDLFKCLFCNGAGTLKLKKPKKTV